MKRYSLILVTVLILGMILPIMPISTSHHDSNRIVSDGIIENNSLATTAGAICTIIKVSDDTPVFESAPDTNWDDDSGGVNLECTNWSGDLSRSWLKFDLTHLLNNIQFSRATVNLFTVSSTGSVDFPRGVYFSENDTWTEETITWNNQPEYSAIPTAVIDSPASPDMFDVGFWYEFEITAEIVQTLEQDGILTLVLSLVDENTPENTVLAFSSREYGIISGDFGYDLIPYISLEYEVPTTTDLLVDGFSESPQIDFINNANPELSWAFNDADPDASQWNYELEVWNNAAYDDILLMHDGNSEVSVVHDTAGAGVSGADVFNIPMEVRAQYKWPSSMISQSGVVDKLYFEMAVMSGVTTYSELAIYMICVEDSSALTNNFQSNYDGRTPIQVLNSSEFTATTEDGFLVFDVENTFIVGSNLNLIIEFRHTGASGTSVSGNYTYSGGSFVANQGSGAYHETTALGGDGRTHGFKLEMMSNNVYSGGASANSIPFGLSIGESGRIQFKYNQSLINDEGIIDKILFPVSLVGDVTYENFSVYLVETPLEGELNHPDMDSNYAGVTPTLVLSADEYIVRDVGGVLVIDVDDIFFYSHTYDLMVEIRFDSLVSGNQWALNAHGGGGYRSFTSTSYNGEDTVTYNMQLEFIYDANHVEYTGTPLVNATTYYWRVRTCDSLGVWSSWETSHFKFEVITSAPNWSNLMETLSPIELGELMTVSVYTTHTTGINRVLLEYKGVNHTMSNVGDTFSYTWTPDAAGTDPYTIYIESYSGTWNTVSDSFDVVDTTAPTWNPAPADKVIFVGDVLIYQLTATDLSGIASWTINDDDFQVIDGLVTNLVELVQGAYYLNVTVTDNEGNSRSGAFIVAVLASTTTGTGTNTTTGIQPSPVDGLSWMIPVLLGVIVVLVIILIIQNRKT